MVERVTITIKNDILKKLDRMIDKRNIKSRSHAVESLLLRAMSKTDINTALILAGGTGARLRPMTYEIPKPMITIHGRPILEYQISMLRRYDIRNILLSVGSMHEKVKEYFGNGSKFGVNITYLTEEKPMGTAYPLYLARDYIKDTFIAMNVDTLMNPDIYEILNFHKKQSTLATILLVLTENPRGGVAAMKGNHITKFIENPRTSGPSLINAGFYILEPDVLNLVHNGKGLIEETLFPKLARENQLSGFVHDGKIFDVGSNEGYEKAIKEWGSI
ncbi:MAG: sugar phosphate nucleotidyltransferase [Candidatus Aenigmatarchaeota archaeon]